MKLIENPTSKRVYLDASSTLYAFDGTPIARPADAHTWADVTKPGQDVPHLQAWQLEPGRYGPHQALAHISVWDKDGQHLASFTAGGNHTYICYWCSARTRYEGSTTTTRWIAIYSDRNAARAAAEVEW
jgi:hypothetical protein